MGSKRGNLIVQPTKYGWTHYHDKSYHKRFEPITCKSSDRYEHGTFTIHVDAG